MSQPCPSCGAATDVAPGDGGSCLECGHDLSPAEWAHSPYEFELQRSRGDQVEGPFDRVALREMLYTGRLTGGELVREPGELHFEALHTRVEFAEVLQLIGKEVGPARGEQRIRGWKAAESVEGAPHVLEERAASPQPPSRSGGGPVPLLIVGGLVVGAVLLLTLLLVLVPMLTG